MFLYIMVGGFVDGFIDAFNIGNGLVDVWWGNALARSVWVMLFAAACAKAVVGMGEGGGVMLAN